ncbi:ATP-binding protein [Actinoplanes sp. NEAU-A12]|uniref:histidine kinase n=1 Tax=Actinoplanes sandaracinus TaxID=3045177 RepID=A0ABT6WZP7_9ACTN|nr:ATP-binding protein [Actinoplanes sandaracinus]MDI6105221.1 ATP-binding protein [Actinoplanes sandaracinus]
MQPAAESARCDNRMITDAQQVLAVAPLAYVAIDAAGDVVAWNRGARDVFGHRGDEVCGRDLADLIIPPRFRPAHRAALARLAAGGPGTVLGKRLNLFAVHADGHEFPIEMVLAATSEPGGPLFHAFAQDVTIAQRVSRFAAVEAAVARGLIEAGSSHAAAARVAEAVGANMGWKVTELWLADDDRRLLCCTARHAATGQRLGAFAVDELELGVGLPGRVHQRAGAVWIPDLAADKVSFRSRAAATIGLHVAVGVPVSAAGHALGALCVYGDHIEDPEDTLTALLAGIAAQVGQYLERRRSEELAVELARTRNEFLALVTHEIRNPLAVITAATSLLDEDLETFTVTEQREQLRTIARSAQRLSVIAEDLLDLARLESGNLALQLADTNLTAIIHEAVQAVRPTAEDKRQTVRVDVPENIEVYADPYRIRQVADNLLSNAVKYTPGGGTITVTAAVTPTDITWTVADDGIGIPAADRPHLFRRFYRASSAVERRIPGTGLGLVITRTIVERHRGTITLDDTITRGTAFVVRLPIAAPPAENG